MSNERKPIVTMADVDLHCGELNEREAVACRWIIERYERLIDSGKLRVVEEVEVWHPSVPEELWRKWLNEDNGIPMLVTRCCGRNPRRFSPYSEESYGCQRGVWLCPGCGNPIRQGPTPPTRSSSPPPSQPG